MLENCSQVKSRRWTIRTRTFNLHVSFPPGQIGGKALSYLVFSTSQEQAASTPHFHHAFLKAAITTLNGNRPGPVRHLGPNPRALFLNLPVPPMPTTNNPLYPPQTTTPNSTIVHCPTPLIIGCSLVCLLGKDLELTRTRNPDSDSKTSLSGSTARNMLYTPPPPIWRFHAPQADPGLGSRRRELVLVLEIGRHADGKCLVAFFGSSACVRVTEY